MKRKQAACLLAALALLCARCSSVFDPGVPKALGEGTEANIPMRFFEIALTPGAGWSVSANTGVPTERTGYFRRLEACTQTGRRVSQSRCTPPTPRTAKPWRSLPARRRNPSFGRTDLSRCAAGGGRDGGDALLTGRRAMWCWTSAYTGCDARRTYRAARRPARALAG